MPRKKIKLVTTDDVRCADVTGMHETQLESPVALARRTKQETAAGPDESSACSRWSLVAVATFSVPLLLLGGVTTVATPFSSAGFAALEPRAGLGGSNSQRDAVLMARWRLCWRDDDLMLCLLFCFQVSRQGR